MEYTAIGHTVGLAQRMEQLAEPGKAYLTEHTATLVEGYLALADLGEFQVKGASQALRVHELTGVGAARGRLDVSRARGFSRFVGRDEEMRGARRRPRAGARRPAAGDRDRRRGRRRQEPAVRRVHAALPGAGDPRLPDLRPGARASRSRCCRCWRSCAPTSTSPSWTRDQTARERIAGKLLLLDESFGEDLPLIFDFLGVPDPERPPPRMDPEARQRQLLGAHQAPRPRPERARARRHRVRGPALARPGQRGVPRQSRRGRPGHARPDGPQLPARVPGAVDVEVLLPPDPAGAARPRGDPASCSTTARLGPVAQRAAGRRPRAHRRQPVLHRGGRASLVEAGNLEGERGAYRLVRPVEHGRGAGERAGRALGSDRPARRSARRRSAGGGRDRQGVPGPMLAQVVELEPRVARRSALDAGDGRVRLRAGALSGDALRVQAPADAGGRLRLAARRAPAAAHAAVARAIAEQQPERLDERPRCWPSTGRAPATRSRRRAGTRAPASGPGPRTRRVAASLAQGARADRFAARRRGDDRARAHGEDLRAQLRMAPRHRSRRGGSALHRGRADGLEGTGSSGRTRSCSPSTAASGPRATGRSHEYARLARQAIALAEESGDPALYVVVSVVVVRLLPDRRAPRRRGRPRPRDRTGGRRPTIGAGIAVDCPLAYCLVFKGGFLGDMAGSTRRAS